MLRTLVRSEHVFIWNIKIRNAFSFIDNKQSQTNNTLWVAVCKVTCPTWYSVIPIILNLVYITIDGGFFVILSFILWICYFPADQWFKDIIVVLDLKIDSCPLVSVESTSSYIIEVYITQGCWWNYESTRMKAKCCFLQQSHVHKRVRELNRCKRKQSMSQSFVSNQRYIIRDCSITNLVFYKV